MKYQVKVNTPGKVIFFRNKKIRSPFTLRINENEVKLLKAAMIANMIDDYKLEEITDDVKEKTWEEVIVPEKEVVVEDLIIEDEGEPKTLLEKLLRDDKNGE